MRRTTRSAGAKGDQGEPTEGKRSEDEGEKGRGREGGGERLLIATSKAAARQALSLARRVEFGGEISPVVLAFRSTTAKHTLAGESTTY